MKKISLLLIFTAFLSCSEKKEVVTDAGPNTSSLIFIDKSVSVNVNKSFVNQKYTKVINDLIEQNINKKGDKVVVYFIHENTAQAKVCELVSRSEKESEESANATDSEAIKTSFDLSLQRERNIFKKQVMNQLESQNTSASKNSTDILGSLPVINKEVAKGYVTKAYFLSDMVESMKGKNKRDFHTNPPEDDASAVGWAREDAVSLKPKLRSISSAEIFIVKPFEPTASSRLNNPAVSTYWERLFRELGISEEPQEL